MKLRVVLVDDQALLRSTFALLINSTDDLEVVGQAGTGAEAIAVVTRYRPDVVLMDIRMPELDGIAATRAISADPELAEVRIIMLTTFEVDELIMDALRAGASGFLGKGVEPAELLTAIRTVAAGDSLLSPAATSSVIAHALAGPAPAAGDRAIPAGLQGLTPREIEILTYVGLGLSNNQIAQHLVISPVTAKTHINRTMAKLHARDRAQLVIVAYENGLVTPGQSRSV